MKFNLNSIPIPTTLNIAISPHLTSPEGYPIDIHQGQPILTFSRQPILTFSKGRN